MAIRESLLNTINTIATSDFVRAVTSAGASSKVTVSNLAKAIIENYAGSSLAGSTQSIKAALDNQKNFHRTNMLAWGAYNDGTYDLTAPLVQNDLLCVLVGDNARYAVMRPAGVVGDTVAIPTGTGEVLVKFNTATNITVSGTSSGKQLRQIYAIKEFLFSTYTS